MKWQTIAIGNVIRSSQYGLSMPTDTNGTTPIVGMKNIQNGRVNIDPELRVELTDQQAEPYLLKDGDILLNRTNSPDLVGKTGIYRGSEKAVFASYLVRLELDRKQVDPDFVIQVLASEGGQREIRRLSTRAISQANINPTTFKKHFPIPLPPLTEQQAISEVLLTWDTAIRETEQLIISKIRFYDFLRKTLLGPGVWKKSKFLRADQLFDTISEKNASELPLLAVTQNQGVIPRSMLDRRISMSASNPANFKVVRENDFVISLRSFQGGLEHSAYEGLVSPAYTVLRCRPELEPHFYRHYLKSPDFIRRLSVAVIGIRDGKQISFRDFASIKLPLPTRDQQLKIARLLDESESEIKLLKRQASLLQKQKRGLMQKLLTGKWRIPEKKVDPKERTSC